MRSLYDIRLIDEAPGQASQEELFKNTSVLRSQTVNIGAPVFAFQTAGGETNAIHFE
jgi:hypothetical protein